GRDGLYGPPQAVADRPEGLAVVPSGVVMAATSLRSAETGALKLKRIRSRRATRANVLAGRAGGLIERGANPVVLAARVQASEELRQRAIPAIASTLGSPFGHLGHLSVLAADKRDGRVRTGFGEDLMAALLIRSDV